MVFASPIFLFLFLFLPAVVALYFALPRRAGNAVLLFASIAFYVWGEGPYAAIVVLVERLKPDVVIEELVERTLNAPLAFPFQVPAR